MPNSSVLVNTQTDKNLTAEIYVRQWQGVLYCDIEIFRPYVYGGKPKRSYQIADFHQQELRRLSKSAQKWWADNRQRHQAEFFKLLQAQQTT